MMDRVTEPFEILDALDDSETTVEAVRSRVEAFAQSLALEEHLAAHPDVRPTLGELAIIAAELGGHPLAGRHEFLRRCADEVAEIRPDANGEDVLLYASGRQAVTA